VPFSSQLLPLKLNQFVRLKSRLNVNNSNINVNLRLLIWLMDMGLTCPIHEVAIFGPMDAAADLL
jgi:hypothetical protein